MVQIVSQYKNAGIVVLHQKNAALTRITPRKNDIFSISYLGRYDYSNFISSQVIGA